jgi:hypothetical protein
MSSTDQDLKNKQTGKTHLNPIGAVQASTAEYSPRVETRINTGSSGSTTYYYDWLKFYQSQERLGNLTSMTPEQAVLELNIEMEAEVRALQQAEKEAEVMLEVIKICEEQLQFHEDVLKIANDRKEDIDFINALAKSINPEMNLKITSEVLASGYVSAIEYDKEVYKKLREMIKINMHEPLFLEFVYEHVTTSIELQSKQSGMNSKAKNNPHNVEFQYAKIKKMLKPHISSTQEKFYNRFLADGRGEDADTNKVFRMLQIDLQPLQKGVDECRAMLIKNKDFVSNKYKVEVEESLASIKSIADSIQKVAADIIKNGVVKVEENTETVMDATMQLYGLSAARTPKRNKIQATIYQDKADEPIIRTITGPAAQLALKYNRILRDNYYLMVEKHVELNDIQAKLSETVAQAKKIKEKYAPHLEKGKETANDKSVMPFAVHKAISLQPGKTAMDEQHNKKQETEEGGSLKEQKEALEKWQAEREKNLSEYKISIQKNRALKISVSDHRAILIEDELKPNTAIKDEKVVKEEVEVLAGFEAEQLLFLEKEVPDLLSFLEKLRQKTLKYSELEIVVKKLSGKLIDPDKHQDFRLIVKV